MKRHRGSRRRLRHERALGTKGQTGPRMRPFPELPSTLRHGGLSPWRMSADCRGCGVWTGKRATFAIGLLSVGGRLCSTTTMKVRRSKTPLTNQLKIVFVGTFVPAMAKSLPFTKQRSDGPHRLYGHRRTFGTVCLPSHSASRTPRWMT